MANAGDSPELRICIARRSDGSVVLHCTRRNGTTTWQHQTARRAAHFVFHDLRHYAVETTLGVRRAFFGLIAEGWEIADTEGKGARGPLPNEALVVEQLVGLLDRERSGGAPPLSAADLRAQLANLHPQGTSGIVDALTDERLSAIRDLVDELHTRWIETGTEMELAFDRGGPAP